MNEMKRSGRWQVLCVFILAIAFQMAKAQYYPDTLWVPVTFYDYRADGSNPNFQKCNTTGTQTGWVETFLDGMHKPVLASTDPNRWCIDRLNEWYRPSAAGGPDVTANYEYDSTAQRFLWDNLQQYQGRTGEYVGNNYDPNYDMATVVIYDSLPFLHLGKSDPTKTGLYQFARFDDEQFFWIDGKGFGHDLGGCDPSVNYSFATEIQMDFEYRPGLTFDFFGDDDVWVFINDSLVLDLGGIKPGDGGSFDVDDIPGLVPGQNYRFSFFHAERKACGSDVVITTNIIARIPSKLDLTVVSDTIVAGTIGNATGNVLDQQDSVLVDESNLIKWSFLPGTTMPGDQIYNAQGDSTWFTAENAHRFIYVVGTYEDPSNPGGILADTQAVWVKPGPPDHLVIEPNPNGLTVRPNDDNPVGGNGSLTLSSTDIGNDSLFATIRDEFGNYIAQSTQTQWDAIPAPDSVVSAKVGSQPGVGQGEATRVGDDGVTLVWANSLTYNGPQFTDTITVTVDPAQYDSLRIVDASRNVIASLTTTIDDTTQLILQARRSWDGQWLDISGDWSLAANFASHIPPPTSQSAWNFAPADTGSGTIRATRNALSTSIPVTVQVGSANSMVFHEKAGVPSAALGNPPLPASLTLKAGYSKDIYAKVFDKLNNWLSNYEIDPSYANQIAWSLSDPTAGSLLSSAGASNTFFPIVAGKAVTVTASLDIGSGIVLKADIVINIIPGDPAKLLIVQDTISRAGVDRVTFLSSDTLKYLYTILEDSLGNYIDWANFANWYSADSTIVSAARGPEILYGQGDLRRRTDVNTSTRIYAEYPLGGGAFLRDSVIAQIEQVTYTALNIYVLDTNGIPDYNVDTVRIRTDETRSLYSRGYRSDGKGWDPNIPVLWLAEPSLSLKQPPPAWSSQFNMQPNATGRGWVRINGYGAAPDSVYVIFLPGYPNKMTVFASTGDPAGKTPYRKSPPVEIVAGKTTPLIAKIFDRNTVWLPQYEDSLNTINLFEWSVSRISGSPAVEPDTLNNLRSFISSFTPYRAHSVYRVKVKFTEGTNVLWDSVTFKVNPDTAKYLVIEADPTNYDPNIPQHYDPVVFDAKANTKFAYAVLRDEYGNFVRHSNPTDWISLDDSIVTVQIGARFDKGEGQINRTGSTGQTRIVAVDRNKPFLFDTATVLLSDVAYERLRIVVEGNKPIEQLIIRSDQDTVLHVQGLRAHDSAWVTIPAAWSFDPATIFNAPGQLTNITFAPNDTGSGLIMVNYPGAVPDTVSVRITPGPAQKLVLYPKSGTPDPVLNPPYPRNANATAGQWFALSAKIFDHLDVWLANYENQPTLSRQISWSLLEEPGNDSSGFFDRAPNGASINFFPVNAHRSVSIVAAFGTTQMKDTITLTIRPGEPKFLYLEPNQNWQASPNDPNPVDTVKITDSALVANVYAIMRDSLGNYVRFSNPTSWESQDTNIVKVQSGDLVIGQGTILRNVNVRQGTTQIHGIDDQTTLRGSAWVTLLPYHYLELRITSGSPSTVIDTISNILRINTNQDAHLKVQGLRSDTAIWEDVPASWAASTYLKFDNAPPPSAVNWIFSPTDTGRGIIYTFLQDDSTATPDTLNVIFDPGPPTGITINILTPTNNRIAGQPIQAVVQLTNRDGLVPTDSCFTIYYQDTLGPGGRPVPIVNTGNDSSIINQRPNGDSTVVQCFNGGTDTVDLVLFYAPTTTDSQHQIWVNLNTLSGTTDPFAVKPGAVDTLVLEHNQGTGDTVSIKSPDDYLFVKSIAYDQYGNWIGNVSTYWSTTDSLRQIGLSTPAQWLYYYTNTVTRDEKGDIISTYPNDSTITANLYLNVLGPLARISNAVTRDTSGNGKLDRIDIVFSLPVANLNSTMLDSIDVTYVDDKGKTHTLTPADIVALDSSGYNYSIVLQENVGDTLAQTAWTPTVTIRNGGYRIVGADSLLRLQTRDGAGPVVWRVVKEVRDVKNPSQDIVTVYFSEPVVDSTRNTFSLSATNPGDLFNVYLRSSSGDEPVNILDGINGIIHANGDTLRFQMSNGNVLTEHHLFNIKVDATGSSAVNDQGGTSPVPDNIKQPVAIFGEIDNRVAVGPNPMTPTTRYQSFVHDQPLMALPDPKVAKEWAQSGGAVFGVKLRLPDTLKIADLRVSGWIKVYDVVGNLVYESENETDMIPAVLREKWIRESHNVVGLGNTADIAKDLMFYWDGLNEQKMPAAPGVYRVFVSLTMHQGSESTTPEYKPTSVGVRN
ncbi:MAG: fibro-slime domain-containing protein [Chitinivibrionales bacterium]|nr:fibro-slime domain-containing protein [Chitinivibrionales bacterium]